MVIRRTYDAMEEREALAHELAQWKLAEWKPSDAAWRWHRRVRGLARICGLSLENVRAELEGDAALLLDDDPRE